MLLIILLLIRCFIMLLIRRDTVMPQFCPQIK